MRRLKIIDFNPVPFLMKNKTGYIGVYKMKCGNYYSTVCINYLSIWLGSYPTAIEAARAYDKKMRELYPNELLILNFE